MTNQQVSCADDDAATKHYPRAQIAWGGNEFLFLNRSFQYKGDFEENSLSPLARGLGVATEAVEGILRKYPTRDAEITKARLDSKHSWKEWLKKHIDCLNNIHA